MKLKCCDTYNHLNGGNFNGLKISMSSVTVKVKLVLHSKQDLHEYSLFRQYNLLSLQLDVTILHCLVSAFIFMHIFSTVQVDDTTLADELKECLPEWSNLGLMLGIQKKDIDIIDERDPYSKFLSEVIHHWLGNSPEPYWEVLIEAIKSTGNKRLGNELAKEYLSHK